MLRLTKNYIHCRKITWQWNVDCLKVIGNGWKWAFPCQFYQQVDDLISNPQLSRIVLHEAQPCGGLVGGEQSTWGTGHMSKKMWLHKVVFFFGKEKFASIDQVQNMYWTNFVKLFDLKPSHQTLQLPETYTAFDMTRTFCVWHLGVS